MLTTALFVALGIGGLAGCNPTTEPSGPVSNPDTSEPDPTTSVNPVVVNSVVVTDDEGEEPTTDVFDNQDIQLKANVSVSNSTDKADQKVTWSVDNSEIATITSTGLLTIDQIKTEEATVTVTATSKVDTTKSASVTFNVKHSLINLLNSKPLSMDTEDYMDTGVISVDDNEADSALVYADVYSTKWYVETELRIMSLNPNDAYPKFGIMTGTNKYGAWQNGEDPFAFYYVDLAQANTNNWQNVNFVPCNEALNDWSWGGQLGGAQLSEKVETTKKFKLGLMRDGIDYYYFYGNSSNNYETYQCYKHITWDTIAADVPSYAWVGGFKTAFKAGEFKVLTGDAVDAMYADLTTFSVGKTDTVLFLNESEQINLITPTSNYKASDFTYTSANPEVASVSSTGLITAGSTAGTTTITVKYKEALEVKINVTVTDDPKFSVVLDGKLEDALWTDEVKNHPYVFSRKNIDVSITLYGSRNSRGIYLQATYVASEVFTSTQWWQDDNMEFRFNGVNGQLQNKKEVENNTGNPTQYWISQFNGGDSNFTDQYVSNPTYDEATGMYTIYFEMFASYEWLGCEPDALIGFSMGANPGGAYWWNNDAWNTYDFYATQKITENGITRYYDETGCEHVYGDFKVVSQASCAQPGEEERFCKLCNHRDTKTVPQGDHSYTGEIVRHSEGSCMGEQFCVGGCGESIPVVMDTYTTHEAWDETAGECTKCHNRVNGSVFMNRINAGGWADYNTWFHVAEGLVGEYDVEVQIEKAWVNNFDGGWWRGILPVVQDADVENGSVFVTRFDWWGWVDINNSQVSLANRTENAAKDAGAVEHPEWMPGENWNEAWSNGKPTISLRMKKTATDIINEWTFTVTEGSLAGSSWKGYAKVTNPVLSTSIRLGLAAEFCDYTVTKVIYHTANFAA